MEMVPSNRSLYPASGDQVTLLTVWPRAILTMMEKQTWRSRSTNMKTDPLDSRCC